MKENTQKIKMGRPPSGIDEEGRPILVSQKYPKTTIYMTPKLEAKLEALGLIKHKAAWRIIEEALEMYMSKLPADDRKLIEAMSSRVIE